jgi:large subunit ribosomal protein L5
MAKQAKEASAAKKPKEKQAAKDDSEGQRSAPPRLAKRYQDEILPALSKKLDQKNRLAVPRLMKIIVSMGVGSAISDKKHIEDATAALTDITGQKPLVTRAKKSIANFRLREGLPIGCKVTLRGPRMYEFLDRLISIALPRVRDFRGLNPEAFDGHGNYSLGLNEQLVFPELNPDKFTRPQGMNIAIVCSGGSNDASRELLTMFGMPFRRDDAAA